MCSKSISEMVIDARRILFSKLHTKLYFHVLFGNILFLAKEYPLLEVFLRLILSLQILLKLLKTLFQSLLLHNKLPLILSG